MHPASSLHELKRVILSLETSRTFGRELLYGIARYSRLHGPWSFYREPQGLKASFPRLTQWKANGIIMRNSPIRKDLLGLKIPTILAIHDTPRPPLIPVVITNEQAIAHMAAEHLLSRALRNFAYCGFGGIVWSDEREMHFRAFLNDAGLQSHRYPPRITRRPRTWYAEQALMRDWIAALPKPVGIMACNDDRGQHILEVCKALRLNVPEEVTVIGVDNDELVCELGDPPLSSVALNTESAGFAAAELLDRLMRGEPMNGQEIVVTATHVVQRQSTDLLAVDDRDVAEGIRFIRLNAKRRITVDDVVAKTGIGRRSLEMHFRRAIHRSIQEEIRRVRVESIARLLMETDMPIAEITDMFSFTDVEHISRYFKKEKGMGLKEYRRVLRRR